MTPVTVVGSGTTSTCVVASMTDAPLMRFCSTTLYGPGISGFVFGDSEPEYVASSAIVAVTGSVIAIALSDARTSCTANGASTTPSLPWLVIVPMMPMPLTFVERTMSGAVARPSSAPAASVTTICAVYVPGAMRATLQSTTIGAAELPGTIEATV